MTAAGAPYCIPNGVTVEQLRDIFLKYLGNHPADRHKAGAFLLRAALREVFPFR